MNVPVAVLDACVLYSAALRDLLMRLAKERLYAPRWTEQIHDEWMENVLANRPELSREKLARTRALMNSHAEGSLVVGYEGLIETLTLPDADDRHVLAAAIAAEASVIVTYNLTDFPEAVLSTYEIEAQHPDVFISRLFAREPERCIAVIQELLAALKNPPITLEDYIETLKKNRLTNVADNLTAHRSHFGL